ncbi:MAG: hypothetical protein ACR2JE_15695 [Acidobacteriaceae bacterium]
MALKRGHRGFALGCAISGLCVLVLGTSPAQAKEPTLSGIQVYAAPSGPAFAEIANLQVNGRIDMRLCGAAPTIDRSAYGKLPRITLAPGGVLRMHPDGSLVWIREGSTACVVPENARLEKGEALTPAKFASMLAVQGRVIASDPPGLLAPPTGMKPGDELVIVSDLSTEAAEYFRADWVRSISGWQAYLSKYPSSTHAAQATQSLAGLEVQDGAAALETYRASSTTTSPDYTALATAHTRAQDALGTAPTDPGAAKLREDVRNVLAAMVIRARGNLQSYNDALAAHQSGYTNLIAAREICDRVTSVDPQFPAGVALHSEVAAASSAFESSLHHAELLANSQHYDDGFSAIQSYRGFAEEEPRLARVIQAAYGYHFDLAQSAAKSGNWPVATEEFAKAAQIRPTAAAAAALKDAQAQSQTTRNQQLANAAIQRSQALVEQRDYLQAYEVLAALPAGARALAAEQVASIQSFYVQSASDRARQLQQVHYPIRGRADAEAMRQAYTYLEIASGFDESESLKQRSSVAADQLSDYYVQQAKAYLGRPLYSGVGLGWAYLDEAQSYRPDLPAIRDEKTRNSAGYQMRSRLSIGVQFRDQTSRTDLKSEGFRNQLQDAIATGLESSGLPVQVIRPDSGATLDPNFELVGEILQHRPMRTETPQVVQSKYRTGERDLPNDAWNKADKDYEAALLEFQRQQSILAGAQLHKKKKEIEQATRGLTAAQKAVEDAHSKLDTLPRTTSEDIVKPYYYTRTTIDITPVVKLSFRIRDRNGATVLGPFNIKEAKPERFVVVDGLKPDDTEGIKKQDAKPDEEQLMIDGETQARDALVKQAQEAVQSLPQTILDQARAHVANSDSDGAAEAYVLYLNCTPVEATPERQEAQRFLMDNFDIRGSLRAAR